MNIRNRGKHPFWCKDGTILCSGTTTNTGIPHISTCKLDKDNGFRSLSCWHSNNNKIQAHGRTGNSNDHHSYITTPISGIVSKKTRTTSTANSKNIKFLATNLRTIGSKWVLLHTWISCEHFSQWTYVWQLRTWTP